MRRPVAEAQSAIASGSQSFAAASRLMPRSIREDTVMLYAWCRHADDIVDGQELGSMPVAQGDPARRLKLLKAQTLDALHGSGPVRAPFAALRAVARRHDFPDSWPLDLIDGFAMDVEGREYRTLNDTLDYSYHVAGIVGVMMARVMGVRDAEVLERACDLGLAFQLTNIARDVIDDFRIGRVYLPAIWLEETGAEVADEIPSPELYAVILRLLDAAEPYYASAFAGLPGLRLRCAWSIAAAARIYHAIGHRIRTHGPSVYRQRISTSAATKTGLAFRGLSDAVTSRVLAAPADRDGLWTRPLK